jgi:hypothetical protein
VASGSISEAEAEGASDLLVKVKTSRRASECQLCNVCGSGEGSASPKKFQARAVQLQAGSRQVAAREPG